MCKHMSCIDESQCAICNGLIEKRRLEKEGKRNKIKTKKELIKRIKEYQIETEIYADKHTEHYTDKELKYILTNTRNISRYDVDKIFDIALHLKRTFFAIDWIWKYAWDNRMMGYKDDNKYLIEKLDKMKIEVCV